MSLDRKLNSVIFPVLFIVFIGLLAWISTHNIFLIDLTKNKRLSLTQPSISLLEKMEDSIEIDVFVNQSDQIGQYIQQLISRYQQIKPDINVNYISPEENPGIMRELNIRFPAEMLIRYQGRSKRPEPMATITHAKLESTITNTLATLFRGDTRWLVFLTGHGERDPIGAASYDLGIITEKLKGRGFNSQIINLSEMAVIPDNTRVLIIADPTVNPLPKEWMIIKKYLNKGGNLLWMTEPEHKENFPDLKKYFNLSFPPDTLVNSARADFISVTKYSDQAITKGFQLNTLFPHTVTLDVTNTDHWNISPVISIDHKKRELLTIALALTNDTNDQRIVVVGDSDFISNAYIGNGGNLELGLRIFNWLSKDDQLINIPVRPVTDLDFELSDRVAAMMGLFYLVIIPIILSLIGLLIWWRRRTL